MANYATLIQQINAAIKTNGANLITGQMLQTILDNMVASLGSNYQYAGVATPETNPGTPDQNVFYLAATAGTYTNFGGLVVAEGEVAALKYNGSWAKDTTGAATAEVVSQLGQQVIYDVTLNNSNHPTFASLSALLSDENLSTLIPVGVRTGGMNIRFVQTFDNKYVQYRLMAQTFSTTKSDWQGVDDEPTAGSNNLVKSGGVAKKVFPKINGYYLKDTIPLELNSFNFTTGEESVNDRRARTSCFLNAPFSIQTNSGFSIAQLLKYTVDALGNISYVEYENVASTGISVDNLNYVYKVTFGKKGDAFVTNADLLNIISSYYGKMEHLVNDAKRGTNANVVNVNTINNTTTGYSLSDAIAAVPALYRGAGCVITFRKTDLSKWEHYQFNVGLTTDTYWLNTANWVNITPEISVPTISDIDQVGVTTQGVSSNREYLNVALIENNNRFLTIEESTISYGQNISGYTTRARTKYYIQAPFYLKLANGFNINSVFRYRLSANGVITYVDSPTTYSPTFFEVTNADYIYRIVLKKGTAGTDAFSQNDIKTCIETFRGINEPNILQSKWVACGDSITQGYYSKEGEPPYAVDAAIGWVHKVERITGKVVNNLGLGGTGWAHGGSGCARQKIDTWINGGEFNGASLVTFAYGVNDWKYNETLGSMDDEVSSSATNIIPSMRYVIERLMETYPELKIVVISPINCSAYGTKANNWGIGYPFSNNGTLEQIFETFKTVCEYYGIEYVDMLHSSVVNRENIQSLLLDGVHPTPEAHLLMARELSKKINCF